RPGPDARAPSHDRPGPHAPSVDVLRRDRELLTGSEVDRTELVEADEVINDLTWVGGRGELDREPPERLPGLHEHVLERDAGLPRGGRRPAAERERGDAEHERDREQGQQDRAATRGEAQRRRAPDRRRAETRRAGHPQDGCGDAAHLYLLPAGGP